MRAKAVFQTIVYVISMILGTYLLYEAYLVTSGAAAGIYPEAAAVFEGARATMPLDITAGFFLIGWPLYHLWTVNELS